MRTLNRFIFVLMSLYLAVPLISTIVYAFSTKWNKTILPEGLTLKWVAQLFSDSRFIESFGRSVLLAGGPVVVAVLTMVPAILIIVIYFPKYEKWIQTMVVMVFAFPPVILAVGLIRAYVSTGVSMILVVAGAYVIAIIPFMYQGTRNSIRNINARELMDAAEILGASKVLAFKKIILPCIYPGVFVASLLSFAVLFGEFVLVNLIVGSRFETVQIYLFAMLKQSGHLASAVVFIYIMLMGLTTLVMATLTKKQGGSVL